MLAPMTPAFRTGQRSNSMSRRGALAALGGAGLVLLTRWPSTGASAAGVSTSSPVSTVPIGSLPDQLVVTPGETGGPFPADGSNANGAGGIANVLADPRSVRQDLRADLDGTNVQEGVPMTLQVRVVDDATAQPLAGAAVYVWHCNRDGAYSAYQSRMLPQDESERSFLRGVQLTDAQGVVTFQTILPGRYQGRAFHIHFEVFADGTYADKLLTSQMAIDDAQIDALYAAAAGYEQALRTDTDNAADGVFGDGVDHQLLTVTGDPATGLVGTFTAVV